MKSFAPIAFASVALLACLCAAAEKGKKLEPVQLDFSSPINKYRTSRTKFQSNLKPILEKEHGELKVVDQPIDEDFLTFMDSEKFKTDAKIRALKAEKAKLAPEDTIKAAELDSEIKRRAVSLKRNMQTKEANYNDVDAVRTDNKNFTRLVSHQLAEEQKQGVRTLNTQLDSLDELAQDTHAKLGLLHGDYEGTKKQVNTNREQIEATQDDLKEHKKKTAEKFEKVDATLVEHKDNLDTLNTLTAEHTVKIGKNADDIAAVNHHVRHQVEPAVVNTFNQHANKFGELIDTAHNQKRRLGLAKQRDQELLKMVGELNQNVNALYKRFDAVNAVLVDFKSHFTNIYGHLEFVSKQNKETAESFKEQEQFNKNVLTQLSSVLSGLEAEFQHNVEATHKLTGTIMESGPVLEKSEGLNVELESVQEERKTVKYDSVDLAPTVAGIGEHHNKLTNGLFVSKKLRDGKQRKSPAELEAEFNAMKLGQIGALPYPEEPVQAEAVAVEHHADKSNYVRRVSKAIDHTDAVALNREKEIYDAGKMMEPINEETPAPAEAEEESEGTRAL